MLIMTRKPGESIAIGANVVVKIMEIKGGRVQLGIDAPKDVKVSSGEPEDRGEIQKNRQF